MRIRSTVGLVMVMVAKELKTASSQLAETIVEDPVHSPPTLTPLDAGGGGEEPPDLTSPGPAVHTSHTLQPHTTDPEGGSFRDTSGHEVLVGGRAREGHFPNGAYVILPNTLNLRGYTSISFRTCSHGTLLYQEGSDGDSLLLVVSESGSVDITLQRLGTPHFSTIPRRFNDNKWHRVYIKFEIGVLTLGVDQSTVMVANSSSLEEQFIDLNLWSQDPQIVIGGNYTGCILEGAGTEISSPDAEHYGVHWGSCPLPDGKDCTGYEEDNCFAVDCNRHGVCLTMSDSYLCQCYSRYTGEQCEIDQGPLCSLNLVTCDNGGVCQEDSQGNKTTCACPIGYTGVSCQTQIDESFCESPEAQGLCENNGTCRVTEYQDRYHCQCLPGYVGDQCEMDEDNCASSPCLHGGQCTDALDDYLCECDSTGYEGSYCGVNIDECSSNPCRNGATCYDLYGDYECACVPGFGGKHCDVEVLECSSDPCQNGGTCTDLQNAYYCSCVSGFEGDNCQHNIDDCYNITCPENSICTDLINDYICSCLPGWSGSPPGCFEVNECDSGPCQNGGSCYDLDNAYTCVCEAGYTGTNCEYNIDDCQVGICQNGGLCIDGIDDFTCRCLPGFFGDFCETNLDECAQNVCVNAVDCIDTEGDYECICMDGWTGKNCTEDIDECLSDPCLNGGSCQDQTNGYLCLCPPGYNGQSCESDINECETIPCLNGGTCTDLINNYTCDCTPDYMGDNCEVEYDACASSPCQNGASCIFTRGAEQDFYCECVDGFEGTLCSNNINDCFDVTCNDGKVCFDLIASYECRCPIGFTGVNCSENYDECQSDPCLNGGTCYDGLANYTCVCPRGFTGELKTLSYSLRIDLNNFGKDLDECVLSDPSPCVNGICQNTVGSYQCYCRPGFSGDHCNLEFDECLSRPCQNNGSCINEINGYTCVCEPGFTGTDCDIDIDECASDPCQNNATCTDGIATFNCECLPGFTDEVCSTNIDECESNPCMNEGQCEDGIASFTCNCSDTGFKGDQCEINIDDCESSPCQHGSTCADLIKDYQCHCFDGYDGKNCENDIEECASAPCQNEATCLERSNLTLYEPEFGYFDNFTYETAGGFICECVPGFTGNLCEINIDECESSPCVSGECIDGINSYRCDCWPGYEGVNCEIEIDECERYQPCIYGSCVDKVADYDCMCDEEYGGKNCSVYLTGCQDIICENGGRCESLLYNEIDHDYKCHCDYGFTGRTCHQSTTMSLNGSSYVIHNSDVTEGYSLSFRFRTTLPDGILAVGQGETYFNLALMKGQLNLQSSLLNKWDGIFAGSDLNDGQWQKMMIQINNTHAVLMANNISTLLPINPVEVVNSTAFGITVLGGATSNLKILLRDTPFFTGCLQDVQVTEQYVIPASVPGPMKVNVEEGCPREEQCAPNPCKNGGECVDLWTMYQCNCERPYLGNTCQLSFTPATFGNEDIEDSLVTVVIPEIDYSTYRSHADVSMLVRTREKAGLIFYLGTPIDGQPQVGLLDTYIIAELADRKLVLRVKLQGPEEQYTAADVNIDDGEPHLLHVVRIQNNLKVYMDHELVLDQELENGGELQARVLYLGGVPSSAPRVKRQLGVSNVSLGVHRPNFKGVLQDVRVSNGTETRLVQPFPLEDINPVDLPGQPLNITEIINVLNGTVSDDTCYPEPCQNNATCAITWNDYKCSCTFGFKGKNCSEREFCAIYSCPEGGSCLNLDDGYECVANLTTNGVNSTTRYTSSFSIQPETINNITIEYRSQVGGVLLSANNGDAELRIGIIESGVVINQVNGTQERTAYFNSNLTLNGDWHLLQLLIDESGIQVFLDSVPLLGTDISSIVDLKYLVLSGDNNNGEVSIGSAGGFSSLNLVNPGFLSSGNSLTAGEAQSVPSVYRGCLGSIRIQNILLPYFSQLDLINNTAANQFLRQDELFTELGCTVCYEHECQNDGYCANPADVYSCSCYEGFTGSRCEVNIDECIGNECQNGATCVDGINQYTCACLPGYEGTFCEEDIDECLNNPCQNGATCYNEIAKFVCECTEEFIGETCSELKAKNCTNLMCTNEAACTDIYNDIGMADDYSCSCRFGYDGKNCENSIDFCTRNTINCEHGSCDLTFQEPGGWECNCDPGWESEYCERDIDDCASNPCYNGAICVDKLLDYECQCPESWEGTHCEIDVDECIKDPYLCANGGQCINFDGGFDCKCDDLFCGQTCILDNPCINYNCSDHGICMSFCDQELNSENQTMPDCVCEEGWTGDFCEIEDSLDLNLAIIIGAVVGLMLVIAIVGLVVFLMMAKKKRATRGTYSPSRQEFYSPRVEMGNMMKPPPEERLI
ncbi:unnamed protein product, partial [Meganyctiphanes norvegica]